MEKAASPALALKSVVSQVSLALFELLFPCYNIGQAVVRGAELWCQLNPPFRCVVGGAVWVVFVLEPRPCGPRSASTCAWLGATWWELQTDLQLVDACALRDCAANRPLPLVPGLGPFGELHDRS